MSIRNHEREGEKKEITLLLGKYFAKAKNKSRKELIKGNAPVA